MLSGVNPPKLGRELPPEIWKGPPRQSSFMNSAALPVLVLIAEWARSAQPWSTRLTQTPEDDNELTVKRSPVKFSPSNKQTVFTNGQSPPEGAACAGPGANPTRLIATDTTAASRACLFKKSIER